jgi:hypothetical protein
VEEQDPLRISRDLGITLLSPRVSAARRFLTHCFMVTDLAIKFNLHCTNFPVQGELTVRLVVRISLWRYECDNGCCLLQWSNHLCPLRPTLQSHGFTELADPSLGTGERSVRGTFFHGSSLSLDLTL